MAEKRALSFPKWLEGGIVLLMLVLAVLEFTHGQWGWALLFGVTGSLFGASLATRLLTGDDDGRE